MAASNGQQPANTGLGRWPGTRSSLDTDFALPCWRSGILTKISVLVPALLPSGVPSPVFRPDPGLRLTRMPVCVLPRPPILGTAALPAAARSPRTVAASGAPPLAAASSTGRASRAAHPSSSAAVADSLTTRCRSASAARAGATGSPGCIGPGKSGSVQPAVNRRPTVGARVRHWKGWRCIPSLARIFS